ncbi:MAG: hypothetical protein LBU56_01350 [Rickettsiales bacterium]|nr:hypothetical protein [Rickettsiales bacterium]
MAIKGTIQFIEYENGKELIQLIIPQSQYEEFQKYKNVGTDGNVIDQEFCAGFTLSDKELYVTGSFPQEEVEDDDMSSIVSSEGEVQGNEVENDNVYLTINFVVDRSKKSYYIEDVQEMKTTLGFDGNTESRELELFKHPIVKLQTQLTQAEEKQALQTQLNETRDQIQQLEQENQALIKQATELWEQKEEIRRDLTIKSLNENALSMELERKNKQINRLNTQVVTSKEQLEAKNKEIAELKQQPSNAKVENLKKDLAAKDTEVQQSQKKNKELKAKKQPTEQSKAPTYTAAVGFGLAAGLIAFIALERTVRLDIWTMVGIVLASALAVSGATYLALKPSTQMNETETQRVNKEVSARS